MHVNTTANVKVSKDDRDHALTISIVDVQDMYNEPCLMYNIYALVLWVQVCFLQWEVTSLCVPLFQHS